MSSAEPMSMHERVHHYLGSTNKGALTPKQSRRARKKDHKNPLASDPFWNAEESKDDLES